LDLLRGLVVGEVGEGSDVFFGGGGGGCESDVSGGGGWCVELRRKGWFGRW